MNKDRALDRLNKLKKQYETDLKEWELLFKKHKTAIAKIRAKHFKERIQALDIAIESLKNDEWVDVRDRLPSESGVYLVTVDYSPPSIQVYEVSYGYSRELEKECFYDYEDGWGESEVAEVIAWKPLPEPYERKE